MFFGKLLPRNDDFFGMFNQHADHIVAAAHSFSRLVANYSDHELRQKYHREVDHAEGAADRLPAARTAKANGGSIADDSGNT